MPIPYLLTHLALAGAAFVITWRWRGRPATGRLLAATGLLVVAVGMLVERQTGLAGGVMRLGWTDAVYFTNLTLAGMGLLLGLLVRAAKDPPARLRAVLLAIPAVAVASASYAWYFQPLPPDLSGRVDASGLCRQ